MRRQSVIGAILAAGLLAAGCSSGSSSSSAAGPSGLLTISNVSGGTWTCQFNPFNPDVTNLSAGPVYEPLAFVNGLQSGKASPWLATSWAWSDGDKVLTFTIRKGVKWADGKPLTPADVVFTFNLLKKYPALDLNASWTVLSSVTQQGSDQVVMTFKVPATTYFYFVADQTPIVPEHIWASIKNPVTYNDPRPVGTGAYTIGACTPQNITYAASKHYWQPGKPKVAKVLYPAFTSNTPANTELADGTAQWGNQFIPDIQRFYASKSADNRYWFPPTANNSLFINLTDPLLSDLTVRRAMAYAIDRKKVSQIGEYGYEPAANQTAIVTPTFKSWYNAAGAASYDYGYNPARAIQILTAGGYHRGSNGIFVSKSGKPLSFTIINVGDYSDFVASLAVVVPELKAAGIAVNVQNLSDNAFNDALFNGHYQLAFYYENGGPAPYYELRQLLLSANSAPVGKSASSNYERYNSPATDALLNSYATAATPAAQHQIVNKLQQVMLSQVPVIPLTESVDWYEYNTGKFTGWATQADPYAQPGPALSPDFGWVLLHLRPKS
ncbi:MAG TPA: ABC transporter substrate-binding protein [Streptosporangiaceae bacterium]|jgi:peptide/nickel transport system substrate-binding protein